MSNEEMNRAIAEVCGWTEIKYSDAYGGWQGYSPDALLRGIYTTEVPNYTGSLDAMHDAEKTLDTDDKRDYYHRLLTDICWRNQDFHQAFKVTHATAQQKAEAYLRCLGRWQEKEKGTV